MILVDIGNSGVRAIRTKGMSQIDLSDVFRLSWPANLRSTHKPPPAQQTSPNQRWCTSEDRSAFEWLVNQVSPGDGETWLVSSVHQPALGQLRSAVAGMTSNMTFNVVTHKSLPFEMDVDFPDKVGIDRVLAAWEAWSMLAGSAVQDSSHLKSTRQRRPLIVAQAGTALTVDGISSDGVYCGGAILPGLGLSLQLLAAGTDQLPWLGNHSVTQSPTLPGRNTLDAIAEGVHASLAGGARFLVERYRSQSSWKDATVVVTGGDGELLAEALPAPVLFQEHLVLRGLWRLGANEVSDKGM